MGLATQLIDTVWQLPPYQIAIGLCCLGLSLLLLRPPNNPNLPPLVAYTLPFVGSAVPFGVQPIKFLQDCQKTYGDCFTILMMGRKMTFCLGADGNHFVFNVPIANASAEGAYRKLTTPVFGKGVVYDCPNAMLMEQKKFVKDSLSAAAFDSYIPKICAETTDLFAEITDLSKVHIFEMMAELTIRTAANCLMGKEIREQLQSNVAKLFAHLDAGLAPINLFFSWLPLPVYINRDRAQIEMANLFKRIIHDRRKAGIRDEHDILQGLMASKYKDGTALPDSEVAGLMISALMGGQHTSSTTTSWILFELAQRPDVVRELRKEQSMVLTGAPDTPADELPSTFNQKQIRDMVFLDCVMKESLRLHPPIHTVMRKVEKDLEYGQYTIPTGHLLCASQGVTHMDDKRFPDPNTFNPSRFLNVSDGNDEWTINGVNIAQKSARSHFLPFGAGRHRCIGEAFGYLQVKTIISKFIRTYDHSLVDGKFPNADFTSLIVVPEKKAYLNLVHADKNRFY